MKRTSASELYDSNLAAKRLGDIAAQKLELKTLYYSKKIELMKEQLTTLNNINLVLSSFLTSNSQT